jgi:hypothetical protein
VFDGNILPFLHLVLPLHVILADQRIDCVRVVEEHRIVGLSQRFVLLQGHLDLVPRLLVLVHCEFGFLVL